MTKPEFQKVVIATVNNDIPPGPMNTFSYAADINSDGLIDYVITGRNGRMVWLENSGTLTGGWQEHLIDEVDKMECGGCAVDLTGNGFPDIINGSDWRDDAIYWWENTGILTEKWVKRLICKTGSTQLHDTLIGKVLNDDRNCLLFTNQRAPGGTTLYCIPLPQNPYVSPWPDIRIVADHLHEPNPFRNPRNPNGIQPEEGLAVGDLDGDGFNELVCGVHWYKYNGQGWDCHRFASGYLTTKIVIGDIDGDGQNEIILSEGDPCVYGKIQGGKLAWFKPGQDIKDLWEEHILEDHLLDAHSLKVGDLCGNGKLDIFCGEVGFAGNNRKYIYKLPRMLVFENDGRANFVRHIIDQGTGIHEAQLADVLNRGVLDIIGKPLQDDEMWQVHVYYNQTIRRNV